MNRLEAFLEQTWDNLLSRDPEKIGSTYASLDPSSQQVVLRHLRKMVSETGWQPVQVQSAQAALQVLESGEKRA